MELIDREAVRDFIKSYRHSTDVAFDMEKHLGEIPTIDAVEVRYGEWLEREVIQDRRDARIPEWQQERCSVCGKWHTTPYMYCFHYYAYCPNCGARMDGERREG